MHVEIKRQIETPGSIISSIYVDGQFVCYGLEPARTTPVHPGHPCIPAGTYKVVLTPSPHMGYVTPELLNVPGRSDIRWHIGNYPKDVLGCIAVGLVKSKDFVGSSKEAFNDHLMPLLKYAREVGQLIDATYTDPS